MVKKKKKKVRSGKVTKPPHDSPFQFSALHFRSSLSSPYEKPLTSHDIHRTGKDQGRNTLCHSIQGVRILSIMS